MKVTIVMAIAIIVIALVAMPPKQWRAPDIKTIPDNKEGELIKYGLQLISRTSYYLGPKGSVAQISNGMNCQNCHLNAGTKLWGNNYAAVASTYPKFRERSGTIESIEKKINDCLERSLNGKAIDSNSREMRAMVAYIKWIGKNVHKGIKPRGTGTNNLKYLNRAADTVKGKIIFISKCAKCHGADGLGELNANGTEYIYPPLWGPNSYNTGAGIYRISKFAGFVKDNMPFNETSHANPEFNDEECWDVAAYVNSQPRPSKDVSKDWPDIKKKPVDDPFGPYADTLSESRHKYGPFKSQPQKQ
ncbi:MAG: c-type cytochrome [Chitinophagaceae bacterium]|nr:c-type cytochrome [Chitinophagaceae bacterium]